LSRGLSAFFAKFPKFFPKNSFPRFFKHFGKKNPKISLYFFQKFELFSPIFSLFGKIGKIAGVGNIDQNRYKTRTAHVAVGNQRPTLYHACRTERFTE
jgi:hypothetical protein